MTQILTFGGMALGLIATLSLFLVLGAAVGTAVGVGVKALVRAPQPEPTVLRALN